MDIDPKILQEIAEDRNRFEYEKQELASLAERGEFFQMYKMLRARFDPPQPPEEMHENRNG